MKNEDESKVSINIYDDVKTVIGQVVIDCDKEDKLPKLEDRTSISTHFNLISYNIKLSDVFVDGCYEIYEIKSFEENILKSDSTVCNCINIVNNQKILLIEGEYGTGKTVLTKMIQSKIKESNMDTLFLDATFFTKSNSFKALVNHISSINKSIYIFIDSVDDLTYVAFGEKNGVIYFLEKIVEIAKKYKHVFFIINSRPNLNIQNKHELMAQYLFYYFTYYNATSKIEYVRTRNFENEEANEFFNKLNISGDVSLSTTQIKRIHRKSQSSYKNQLFDYCIGTYYYDNNCTLPADILTIYSYFVETTIGGKFKRERTLGSSFIEKIGNQYKKILQSLAKEMIVHSSNNIDYKDEELDFCTKFKKIFCIKIDTFENYTEELYDEYKKSNETVYKGYYDASFLNCYFFKVLCVNKDQVLVCFSDENVMCYLVAESIYERLRDLSLESIDSSKSYDILLEELTSFELHPLTMDFLFLLLSRFDTEQRERLVSHLKKLIDDFNSHKEITEKEIRSQLVLQILFIKLNKKSYKALNSLHFFKSFDKLCKTIKDFEINGCHVDGQHRYLAERYFTNSYFIDCCFRRLNLKYYNYKKSHIIHSSFEQCKLDENIFDESIFKNSRFLLCMLSNISFSFIIFQDILFENCKISNCNFQNISLENNTSSNIFFKRCSIEKMNIIFLKSSYISITFENCFIKEIFIENCSHNNHFSIKNCMVEKSINVSNSKIKVKEQGNLLSQQHLLELDNRSEIIKH